MSKKIKHSSGAGFVRTLTFGAAICGMGAVANAGDCSIDAIQAMVGSDTTITSAAPTAEPAPHCRIDGYVTTTDPGPNKNNFRLQLPDEWNNRFYFIGMGGSAGYVPTDSQIPSGNPVAAGFAVAGTDTGHQAHLLDWSFLDDPAQRVDHIHRGAHVVTVATQKITKAYYDADKLYRYHSGCSGGGRMGMEAIKKHPEDYDGVLLGWPGGRWPEGKPPTPYTGQAFTIMVREMTREPGSWLSPAKLKLAEEKVTEACDMTDGANDGVIWDHTKCEFDFSTLQCEAGDGPECLTQPEITSINNLLHNTSMPISNMTQWSGFLGRVAPPWSPEPSVENMPKASGAHVILTTWARTFLNQPDRDVIKDPLTTEELERMNEIRAEMDFGDPEPADLSGLKKAGGKAIFFAGVSDPCCSNIANKNWLNDVADNMGGKDKLAQFVTFYDVPGWGHCGGGTGPGDGADRLLQELINWVEKGETPGPVEMHSGADRTKPIFNTDNELATESGVVIPPPEGGSRDFLVCPWGQVSVFDQSKANVPGAVNEAENWSCQKK